MKKNLQILMALFSLGGYLSAQNLTDNLILDEELSALRAINVTKKSTFSDLCKLVLIHRNELEKYPTDEERCARLAELGIYDTKSVDYIHLTPLKKGAAAKAAIRLHKLETTLLFQLLGWEWYAIQNAEALGILEKGSNSWDELSGEELITMMDLALAKALEKDGWMKEKNPYKEFGFDSYQDMDKKTKPESTPAPETKPEKENGNP
ncbi:MAG: hypothetical protein KF713_07050 [Turneriella sp.]|nr:hypothetical protein [Turneriella sp.]